MRLSFVLVALSFLTNVSYCQDSDFSENAILIGLNGAFFGAGDVVGPAVYTEYNYSINKFVSIAPRIMFAQAQESHGTYFKHLSSLSGSIAMKITPFPTKWNGLKFDIGGLYNSLIDTYGARASGNGFNRDISGYGIQSSHSLFGLLASMSVHFIKKEKLTGGWRADMLTSFSGAYFNCDSIQTGLFIGFKL